jgi:lysophospholipase L1-like esterase
MIFFRKNKNLILFGAGLLLFIAKPLAAGHFTEKDKETERTDTLVYNLPLRYKFPKAAVNQINDKKHALYPFFEKMSMLQQPYDTIRTDSNVHIGDSHIQADILTGKTRRLVQRYFGNPGRGLIAPQRLARSNNGQNYKITSENAWEHATVNRAVGKACDIPVGITGLGLRTGANTAQVHVETTGSSRDEWLFNKVTAYCDLATTDVYAPNALSCDSINEFSKILMLDTLTNCVDISLFALGDRDVSLSGFNLANGENGVFYHSIGINGARYEQYNSHPAFCRQLTALTPDLIIISLGTNEAIGRSLSAEKMSAEIDEFVTKIQQSSPQAVILLTTPSETCRNVRVKRRRIKQPNTQIARVRDVIVNYAADRGFPCWDLFSITGGKGSSLEWNKKKLMARDGVHLNAQGYEYQGELLFDALMKSYNDYLAAKHDN